MPIRITPPPPTLLDGSIHRRAPHFEGNWARACWWRRSISFPYFTFDFWLFIFSSPSHFSQFANACCCGCCVPYIVYTDAKKRSLRFSPVSSIQQKTWTTSSDRTTGQTIPQHFISAHDIAQFYWYVSFFFFVRWMFVFISLFVVGCSSQHNHLTFLAYRIAFVMAQRKADGHFFRVAGLGQSNQQCELEERHHQVEMVNMMLARRLCIVLVGFFIYFRMEKI